MGGRIVSKIPRSQRDVTKFKDATHARRVMEAEKRRRKYMIEDAIRRAQASTSMEDSTRE